MRILNQPRRHGRANAIRAQEVSLSAYKSDGREVELLTGIEGASSRPVRKIVLRQCRTHTGEGGARMPRQVQTHPRALLSVASEYADAASELLAIAAARPQPRGPQMPLSRPIYFLFSHAAELAFKAFLRSKNAPVDEVHGLTELYETCRNLGLMIGPDDRTDIGNVVSLLDSGNKRQGFRYFELQTTTIPELSWTHETVGELIQVIEPHIRSAVVPSAIGAQVTFTFPKPTKKRGR